MIFLNKRDKQDYSAYRALRESCALYNRLIQKYFWQEGRSIKVPNIDKIPNGLTLGKYLISVSEWKQIIQLQVFIDEKNVSLYEYLRVIISNWQNIKTLMNIEHNTPLANMVLSVKFFGFYQQMKNAEIKKLRYLKKKGIKEADEMLSWASSIYEVDISNLKKIQHQHSELKYKEIVMIFQGEFSKCFRDYVLNGTSNNTTEDSKIRSSLTKQKISLANFDDS